jgi:uncharacterized protein YjbJ (UPF0337 family)
MWSRDEIKGRSERLKGRLRQSAADLANDEQMRNKGVAQEAAGEVQETFGKGKRKIGEAIEDLGEAIKR